MSTSTEKIDSLIPADYNPRTITPEAMEGLKASIKRFGQVQEIVRNTRTGHIVGGHQRVQAMRELGFKTVRVYNKELSDAEERALNVVLNSDKISGTFTPSLNDLLDEIRTALPIDYEAMLLEKLRPHDYSNFEEPDQKGESGARETELIKCPNCGVTIQNG